MELVLSLVTPAGIPGALLYAPEIDELGGGENIAPAVWCLSLPIKWG